MNIKQAKEEIKRSISVYLSKDSCGKYRMPCEKQRPLFILGAPGIGKTAAVREIAREMDLPMVSYALTHHTRQSAIGLPLIEQRLYQEQYFDVSIYTLSEIIASVYETMEKSGKKEGILFLDEINCVSETLAPAMMQFLQYKTFASHKLPEGWMIVTAGNPRIFNRNAVTFDTAMLDRLKILEVEPDYETWKEYAIEEHIHPLILSFLDIHKDYFFHIQTGTEGMVYATPRGWEDLSRVMILYQEKNYPLEEELIRQYIHDERITSAFGSWIRLYGKYQENYRIQEILNGSTDKEMAVRMRKADWDERISVTNLLLDTIGNEIREEQIRENGLRRLRDPLRSLKEGKSYSAALKQVMDNLKENAPVEKTDLQKKSYRYMLNFLHQASAYHDYSRLRKQYGKEVAAMMQETERIENHLHHLFEFLQVNASQQELLIAVTRLTVDEEDARFIARHGCEDYYTAGEALNMEKRNEELMKEINLFRGRHD